MFPACYTANVNIMNARLQYEIRGWAYWAKCLNPLRDTITIGHLPLGLQLQAYKRDAVGRGLFRRKIHEPSLTQLLLARFANTAEKNFIDVGANIGYFSCLMSIEPEPQNLRLLENNIKLNNLTNVVVHPCALGSREGSAMLGLYKPSNRGRHSLLEKDAKSQIKVPVRTLDDIARDSGRTVRSWSLVKIDVEGYEGFVIEGAKETLPQIEMLVMEFSPSLLKKDGADPAAILSTLATRFSRIHRIEPASLVKVTAEDCLGNDSQMELLFER
jgi:FkbM family methyltransferase